MKFVPLNLATLIELYQRGFNILRSNSSLSDENPTWIPETINLSEFLDLDSEQLAKLSVPLSEKHFLIIENALKDIRDEDFFGEVMIEFNL